MARTMPPLAGAIEFGEDDAGDVGGFSEDARLLQAVLTCGCVHDEEGLVGCAGDEFFRGATHLVELLHQIGLGVRAAGGVNDDDLCAAGLGGGRRRHRVRRRDRHLVGFDDLNVGALGPDFELFDGGGAEGVGGAEQDGAACAVK